MFTESYIMTGIIAILAMASWQKPKIYTTHFFKIIFFINMMLACVYVVWDISIYVSIMNLPDTLDIEAKKLVLDSVNKSLIPTSWWGFYWVILILNFALNWVSHILLENESKAS